MKFAIYRKDLIDALSRVVKVVPSVKVSPILTYVLVRLQNDTLSMTATDLSNFITISVPCKSAEDGLGLFPAQEFLTAIKSVSQDAVVITYEDNMLKLRSGNSGWNWKTLDPSSFSKIPQWEQSKVFVVDTKKFVSAARKVKNAVAVDSFSKNLEQIGFVQGKLMAADGARFHQSQVCDLDTNLALPSSFVDDLSYILPLLDSDTFEIGATAKEDAIVVRCSNVVISTMTKKEKFPDLNKAFLIPAMTNYNFVKVNKAELLDSIKRVRIVADKSSRLVKMTLSPDSSKMCVSAAQLSGTSATDLIDVDCPPQTREINVNVDYFVQALAVFDEDVIEFRLGNDAKNKPSTILIKQDDDVVVMNQLRA